MDQLATWDKDLKWFIFASKLRIDLYHFTFRSLVLLSCVEQDLQLAR